MKKFSKKLINVASLALALTLTLSACNNAGETDSSDENTGSTTVEGEDNTGEGAGEEEETLDPVDLGDLEVTADPAQNVPNTNPDLPLTDEEVTYNVMITYSLGTREPNDMALYQERVADTGVNLDFDWVLQSVAEERVSTTLASGNLPDMFVDLINADQIASYGDETGQFLEITDYATDANIMPNLAWIFEQEPMVLKASRTTEGNLYGVPAPNYYSQWPGDGRYIRTSQVINKTWLDELGLEIPTTTDEFVEVLTAFRDGDPNGNGEADEIPYSFWYGSGWAENFDSTIFGPFGLIGPGTHRSIEDGEVKYSIQRDGYIEAIQYANQLWSEGLIDEEAFTHDQARFTAKGQSETPVYGVVNGWTGADEVGDRVAMEAGGQYEYVPFAPLAGPDGTQLWRNEYSGLGANRAVFSEDVENPELLMRYMDYLYTPDQSIQEVYGMFEHQTQKAEDGVWAKVDAPEGWNVEEWLRDTTTRRMPSYISSNMAENIINTFDEDGNPLTKSSEMKYQFSDVYADYAQDLSEVIPPARYTQEELDIMARLRPQVENAITEQEVRWITGQGDIETEYDDFIASLEALQMNEVLAQYQAAVDRWNAE